MDRPDGAEAAHACAKSRNFFSILNIISHLMLRVFLLSKDSCIVEKSNTIFERLLVFRIYFLHKELETCWAAERFGGPRDKTAKRGPLKAENVSTTPFRLT